MLSVESLTFPTLGMLSLPFDESALCWEALLVIGNRALVTARLSTTAIRQRLTTVCGADNWKEDYETLPEGAVLCRLSLRMHDVWYLKMDLSGHGATSSRAYDPEITKANALRHVAAQFGLGRYLYRLPARWLNYDPETNRILDPIEPFSPPTQKPQISGRPRRSSKRRRQVA